MILVYIQEKFDYDAPNPAIDYQKALLQLATLELRSGESKQLAENCWLLLRESDLLAFAKIVSTAADAGLHWEARFLSDD